MPVKVSVVVPVYNPGRYIEDCVASLLRQSLPPDEYEVIFVDDGSTDGTPALLDALAAEHSRVHVVHQANSGWSGKPRNVGIAAARGEYVMFVDNDDYLGDEALERMYDYGVANGADVVVGKMAGRGRGVPVELFRVDRPRAGVDDAPLIDSLTPHKMVRRAFLDRTGLRFPEGRRRLEDHVFVTEAYLRADNVSVLADYVCYYHVRRDDSSNAGFQRFDPVGYFKNLREALDVVERYTEPGPLRDRLFRRWLRVEMVERLRGRRLLSLPEDFRRDLFEQIHQVVVERFGPGVAAGLPAAQRVVAVLAAAGRLDDVMALAEWEASVGLVARTERVEWRDGALHVGLSAEFTLRGEPMTFAKGGARPSFDAPPRDAAEAVAWLDTDSVTRFGTAALDLVLRDRASSASYFQPVRTTHETVPAGDGDRVRLVLRATATADPRTAAGGMRLDGGLWDAFVRVRLGGWTKECRLGRGSAAALPHAGVVAGRVVLPYWTEPHANLSLDVDRARDRLGLGRSGRREAGVSGGALRAALPLYVPDTTEVRLRLTGPANRLDVPATLAPGGRLEAALPVAELAGATWRTALGPAPHTPGEPRFLPLPLTLRGRAGGVRLVRTARPGLPGRLARRARRVLRAALRRAADRVRTARR
ncbi:cell wall biosynthesis glycosyltransferase [Streptomyces sp. AS58]|uniref:glycosyltransferase family 2 protein n=1 Tax=Streptomyces sp. AS58 TaxID=1519489 RepID=UPI0006AF0398|nr:glycosyltransferase [Streptomyces sp. AS58]KOV72089.1 cell wall biosynthesis glycosyltransferase [Streptomyces sp. AS58]